MKAKPEALWNVGDVAGFLSVRPSTIYEWCRIGYIPHMRLGVGRKKPLVRFSREAVEEWLAKRARKGRTRRIP